jgi:hypothetical protein
MGLIFSKLLSPTTDIHFFGLTKIYPFLQVKILIARSYLLIIQSTGHEFLLQQAQQLQ